MQERKYASDVHLIRWTNCEFSSAPATDNCSASDDRRQIDVIGRSIKPFRSAGGDVLKVISWLSKWFSSRKSIYWIYCISTFVCVSSFYFHLVVCAFFVIGSAIRTLRFSLFFITLDFMLAMHFAVASVTQTVKRWREESSQSEEIAAPQQKRNFRSRKKLTLNNRLCERLFS